jgi:hypothetical protein
MAALGTLAPVSSPDDRMHETLASAIDWPTLIATARTWPVLRAWGAQPHERDLHLLLQAPVTLAWWLQTFAPELLARPSLDLLVIGIPGGPSSTDEGRPYQLLPALLGRDRLRVNVTVLVGSADPRFVPAADVPVPETTLGAVPGDTLYPALRSEATIPQWWELCRGGAPDACVVMQPNLDRRPEFWSGLRLLHEARVPVGCFARSFAEAERDAWLLRAYGYDVTADAVANPWAQRWAEPRGRGAWAAVAWRFAPSRVPGPGVAIDRAALERAAEAQRSLQHEFEVWNPLEFIGQRVVVPDAQGVGVEGPLVGLPDHHALSLATGHVWQLEPDGPVPVLGNTTLPGEVVQGWPGDAASGFERLLWAVDVFENEFRPREAAAIEAMGLARAEQLKDSVSQALQGRASAEELAAFEGYYLGGEPPTPATPGSDALFEGLRKREWSRAADLVAERREFANAVDEDGRTPLFYAMRASHLDLARRLLDAGADPDRLDHEGFAVVHDMAKRDDRAPIELLERYGADLDRATGLGMTPAVLALRYKCWSVLAYLIARGADLTKSTLPGASVAEQYGEVDDLPRVLRAEIDRRLGRRHVIPIVPAPLA